ncbi:accessory Sec system glycosyltransferase GtfA [Macrococcus capreoli]
MTIYNLNFGIGWASSGVEYAQKYRADLMRSDNIPFKNIFLDFFSLENIQTLTENMSFQDHEIIWLYQHFTDIKIAPTTYTLNQFVNSLDTTIVNIDHLKKNKILHLKGTQNFIRCFMKQAEEPYLDRVEYVLDGKIIRKDVFTYTKLYSEYYAPKNNKSELYMREFFNEDGSIAFTEYLEGESIYKFSDCILYGKPAFISYFIQSLKLSKEDIVLIDRSTDLGPAILKNIRPAQVGVVVHAEHYNAPLSTENNILWNNHYEYMFHNHHLVDFFIVSTEQQELLLKEQFDKYYHVQPVIYTIPVGSIASLVENHGQSYSIMTASRLASEKHIDWLIDAVVKVKAQLPELTFDIYGEGGERDALRKRIIEHNATHYIALKGHAKLQDIYPNYQLFLSGSTSEGFGLTLLEAVGSGLGLIGLDVNYGNPTFIRNDDNGYLLSLDLDQLSVNEIADAYSKAIINFFNNDITSIQHHSHKIAEAFLEQQTLFKWKKLIKDVSHD